MRRSITRLHMGIAGMYALLRRTYTPLTAFPCWYRVARMRYGEEKPPHSLSLVGGVREGHTGCEGTEWESETSVRCLVGGGARGTLRVS
eukprot:3812668-Rhodomonas_salina.2